MSESDWLEQERRNCDSRYGDRELNKYCHEVVERELGRRKTICEQ